MQELGRLSTARLYLGSPCNDDVDSSNNNNYNNDNNSTTTTTTTSTTTTATVNNNTSLKTNKAFLVEMIKSYYFNDN